MTRPRPTSLPGPLVHRAAKPGEHVERHPTGAMIVGCTVCRNGSATLTLSDYSWTCDRCEAVGHWSIQVTCHPLVGSVAKAYVG